MKITISMLSNILRVLLISLLSFIKLHSQEHIHFHQLTSSEGLSQSNNSFLYMDSRGYTWISSLDGLNRFDGKIVAVFKSDISTPGGLKGGNMQSHFFENQEGDILFSTNEAVNRYDIDKDVFDNFDFNKKHEKNIHYLFHIDKNFLWATANNKLYQCDIDSLDIANDCSIVEDTFFAVKCEVIKTQDGGIEKIISYGVDNGIEILELDNRKKIVKRDTFFNTKNNPSVTPLFFSKAITDKDECWLLNKQKLVYYKLSNPLDYKFMLPPIEGAELTSINSYQDSLLWVSTTNPTRLFLFNKNQQCFLPENFHLFNIEKKKSINKINDILTIRGSIIWISTLGEGVFYANIASRRIASLFNQFSLESQKVHQVFEGKNGNIQCVTEGQELLSFPTTKDTFHVDSASIIKCIIDEKDRVWNLGRRDISYRDSEEEALNYIYRTGSFGKILFDITNWNKDWLVFIGNEGIKFIHKTTYEIQTTTHKDWTVHSFKDSENHLWTAGASGELIVWNVQSQNGKPKLQQLQEFNNLGLINHLTEDKARNGIWVGTSEGLLLIDIFTLGLKQRVTEIDGLPNQSIYAIALDDKQRLWLSSNKGIIRYAPDEVEEERFRNFTSRDGLSSDEYSPGAVYVADDGEIWFGSTKGVDIFHPDDMKRIGKAPQLAISSLKIHDKEWKGEWAINAVEDIELDHKNNSLTFELAAMEYTDPLRNQFKVFLQHRGGIDSTHLGTKNSITYANLSPGDYTFSFTACNSEGIWQEVAKKMSFYIIPPIYQRTWFRALMTVLVLALVSFLSAFYYRYQLRAKEVELLTKDKENLELGRSLILVEERIRIARDMHDQLGSGLSRIQNLGLRTSKKEDSELLQKGLQKIASISRNLKKNMRELIWAMSSENDSLDALMAWIRLYIVEYLADNGLEVSIDMPDEVPDVVMNGRYRYNIILGVKEILHNIVKHAEATEVQFETTIKDQICICIRDNGKGFVYQEGVAALGKNIGLRGTKERITSIGGTIEWNSEIGKGTEVCTDLPLYVPK